MPMTVSVDAARRQSFGRRYEATPLDDRLAAELKASTLSLRPHPDWELPETPSWDENPYADRNWVAQYHMLRWMDPLRRAAEKGDRASAERWIDLAETWVRANPPVSPASPVAWTDMVDGLRALEFCLAVPFVMEEQPEALEWLIPSIVDHAEWLCDEKNLGHSNHALHQHQGLFVCGAVLQETRYMELAERRLGELFEGNYDHEGINAEGAITYHLLNYQWWLDAKRRLEVEGRPVPSGLALLDQAPLALAHATKPDGTFVTIGDTDGGHPRHVDHPATTWVTSNGSDGAPPEENVAIYDAGYLFARSGWGEEERDYRDETFFSVSFGKANRVHGHADGAALTFSSLGKEWVTDPGKFQYGTSPMRKYCLARESHSLPYIKGAKYNAQSTVRCTRKNSDSPVLDFIFQDTGYQGVTITRRVLYSVSGEYLVVVDVVNADHDVVAIQNWQCAAGIEATETGQGFSLASGNSRAAIFYSGTRPDMKMTEGAEDPPKGWVSTGWKVRKPAPAIEFQKSGQKFRFITIIAAGFRAEVPTVQTVRGMPAGQIGIRVDTGRVAEQMVIDSTGGRIAGYSEDVREGPKSSVAGVAIGKKINALNGNLRTKIFTETRRARKQAWGNRNSEERQEIASALSARFAPYDLTTGVDLGLGACLHDLTSEEYAGVGRKEVRTLRPGLINWNSSRSFQPTLYKSPVASSYGTTGNLPTLTGDTVLTFNLGALVLPALVAPAPGNTLTVMLQGAIDRARTRLPLFQRMRFQKELDVGPTLAFSDPTLDLSRDLRLGWYLGTEEIELPKAMSSVIKNVAVSLGAEQIVIQGSSGGGFAALQVGSHLPDSHVVAINPQIDLRRYNQKAYRAAVEAAFGTRDIPSGSELEARISVIERMKSTTSIPDITLVMNDGDMYHERNHAEPFREFMSSAPGADLRDVRLSLGPGHKSPDNDQYSAFMLDLYRRIGSESPGLP